MFVSSGLITTFITTNQTLDGWIDDEEFELRAYGWKELAVI